MAKTTITAGSFRPIKNNVFVINLDHGSYITKGGIFIPDDNMRDRGIRDRWAEVWKVGPEITDITPGEWVLIKHGRWTNGIDMDLPTGRVRVWRVDYPEAVLCASDVDPRNYLTEPKSSPAKRTLYIPQTIRQRAQKVAR